MTFSDILKLLPLPLLELLANDHNQARTWCFTKTTVDVYW